MHHEHSIIGKREHWGGTETVGIAQEDRRYHTHIIGKTGSGKTTLVRNLIVQDIEAGRGVAVIDPHGDLADELLDFIPPRRIDDVIYFSPADHEHPVALNILRGHRDPALAASVLVSAFKSIWSESWGPRLEYILYATLASLIESPHTTILGVQRMLIDETYRWWVVNQVKDPMIRSFWVNEFDGYEKRMLAEMISPILNKSGQFGMAPVVRNILGQVRTSINFRRLMDSGQILIANLSKGSIGEDKSHLLGALLVSQLQLAAMSRQDIPEDERRDFNCYIDEFQAFSSESFISILSEARKYRLNLTLSHQYLGQLPEKIRDAVLGNVGQVISFRIGFEDAEIFSKDFGNVCLPEALSSLNRFHAFVRLTQAGEYVDPFGIVTLSKLGRKYMSKARILQRSREWFTRDRKAVEQKIERWIAGT